MSIIIPNQKIRYIDITINNEHDKMLVEIKKECHNDNIGQIKLFYYY